MAFWNITFSAFYVALAFAGLSIIGHASGLPRSLPSFDILLMILATFRLTRMVVYDSIFEFFRSWFKGKEKGTFMGTLHSLINCPWCMGLWFSLFVTFFYFYTPIAWFFILFLAIASVASILQVFSNLLGWNAEYKKREVLLAENDPKNVSAYHIIDTGSKCG